MGQSPRELLCGFGGRMSTGSSEEVRPSQQKKLHAQRVSCYAAGMSTLPYQGTATPHTEFPVTTTFTLDGYRIVAYKGVVRGIVVRSPTIPQGILGGLKSIIGGNIEAYTEMCEQARHQAYERMIQHAAEQGANAVVGLRYDASDVGSKNTSATEVLCYGTAVVVEKI